MALQTKSDEQRHHVRYQLRGNIFDGLFTVTDLSRGGIGFESICQVKKLEGKRLLFYHKLSSAMIQASAKKYVLHDYKKQTSKKTPASSEPN